MAGAKAAGDDAGFRKVARTRPYYAGGGLSAAYYDSVTAADPRLAGDVELYAGLAPPGGAVLELGAGSGRVAAALAERGFRVTGVEIAPAMLAQARTRRAGLAPEAAERLELRQGDMTALRLARTYDAVVCAYFTLAHVPAGTAWRNTFAAAARHLEPGGLAAFHLPRLDVMRLPRPANPDLPVLDRPLEGGRRLLLFVRERAFREDLGRLDQLIEYALVDAAGRLVERSPERLTYWMADPQPLAAAAGLVLDRPPIELGGIGDIWVFRKR
jgi:SAM-dependent methyltransferase